jgi:hypothetical protein
MLHHEAGEGQVSAKKIIITKQKRVKSFVVRLEYRVFRMKVEIRVTSVVYRSRSSFVVVSRYVGDV